MSEFKKYKDTLTFREKINIRHIIGFFKNRFYLPLIYTYDKFSDFKRGVHTQAEIFPPDLDFNSSLGNHYEAARYKTLKNIIKESKKKGYSAFLDIGCGLGRPLIVAKEVGFSKLYGVDISQKLIDQCVSNLNKLKIDADITCCDIDNYLIPNEDLVILMFNSLKEDRLISLIEKLYKRTNKCLFIFVNPNNEKHFSSEPVYKYDNWHFGLFHEGAIFYEIN